MTLNVDSPKRMTSEEYRRERFSNNPAVMNAVSQLKNWCDLAGGKFENDSVGVIRCLLKDSSIDVNIALETLKLRNKGVEVEPTGAVELLLIQNVKTDPEAVFPDISLKLDAFSTIHNMYNDRFTESPFR
jgi:hypothetical protein